jgi:hypothetical protein
MDGAKIADASILNASIKNAAVDTLKIKDAAVTAQYLDSDGGLLTTSGAWETVNYLVVDVTSQGTLRIDWQIANYNVAPTWDDNFSRDFKITVDGNDLAYPYNFISMDRWVGDRWSVLHGYTGIFYVTSLSAGSHAIRTRVRTSWGGDGRECQIEGGILVVTEAKK